MERTKRAIVKKQLVSLAIILNIIIRKGNWLLPVPFFEEVVLYYGSTCKIIHRLRGRCHKKDERYVKKKKREE